MGETLGFTKASAEWPFSLITCEKKGVKLFFWLILIIINNQITRKRASTPFFAHVTRDRNMVPKLWWNHVFLFEGKLKTSFFKLLKTTIFSGVCPSKTRKNHFFYFFSISRFRCFPKTFSQKTGFDHKILNLRPIRKATFLLVLYGGTPGKFVASSLQSQTDFPKLVHPVCVCLFRDTTTEQSTANPKMELALYNSFRSYVSKATRQMPQSMLICTPVPSQVKRYVQAWKQMWSQVNCFFKTAGAVWL